MGQHAEVTFALSGGVGLAAQRRIQQPFVPREGALGLPALAVDPLMPAPLRLLAEALDHLPAVARLGPLAAPVAAVERDHGGADTQALAAQPVVLLAIEGGIAQHPVPGHAQRRLPHGRAELRGVVAGADGDGGGGEEMAGRIADDSQLRPGPARQLPAGPLEEVLGSVPALQAGGIYGGLGPLANQAAVLGARGGLEEEADDLPFFSSRPAA